jgi:hypothetical protein
MPRKGDGYLRSERQCLVRLPRTGAVIFTIHTCVVARESLNGGGEGGAGAPPGVRLSRGRGRAPPFPSATA